MNEDILSKLTGGDRRSIGRVARQVRARYLVAADGLYSQIRKRLRPDDFLQRTGGGTMNYYCHGEGDLDPNTLYMVYKREMSPLMFAWAYLKDDQWVIGTGADDDLKEYADRFYDYICGRYNFRGQIVRREGFASPLVGGIDLGRDYVLLVGDAAGLVDAYRGLGMDNAAISARLAVRAIVEAENDGCRSAGARYRSHMRGLVEKLGANNRKQDARYASDRALEDSLSPWNMLKGGLAMQAVGAVNRLLPAERVITLPL